MKSKKSKGRASNRVRKVKRKFGCNESLKDFAERKKASLFYAKKYCNVELSYYKLVYFAEHFEELLAFPTFKL